MVFEELCAKNAPSAIGPYSQAIKTGDAVYVSGQLPIDPKVGKITGESIGEQTHQSLENIKSILKEADMDLTNVVKTTVLLSDIADFTAMNEVYGTYFTKPFPARAAFQVAALPMNAKVEIEVVAVSKE